MRKLILALSYAGLVFVGIGVGGCETRSYNVRHDYPPADESVRPNSKIPQAGTDFLDDD